MRAIKSGVAGQAAATAKAAVAITGAIGGTRNDLNNERAIMATKTGTAHARAVKADPMSRAPIGASYALVAILRTGVTRFKRCFESYHLSVKPNVTEAGVKATDSVARAIIGTCHNL